MGIDMADNVYVCENCGGIMVFDAKTQSLKCPNCDTVAEINIRVDGIVEHPYGSKAAATYRTREKTSSTMECKGCGATIEVDKDSTATICPYCGSEYVLSSKQEEAILPDGVIPFQIDRNNVNEIFGKWIKGLKMAPGELKALYQQGKIQGRYVPFWTFDADTVARYTGMGGRDRVEHYRDKDGHDHTRTVTEWHPTSGVVRHFFDDVLIRGTENLKGSLVNGMDDYNLLEAKPYSPDYFSGFLAESYTVDLPTAHGKARGEMESRLRTMASEDICRKYDHAKDVRVQVDYSRETYKHMMLPLYATSYSYKGKNYTVLVNGQNGRIKGEYPKSPFKIALIVIAILAALALLWFATRDDRADGYSYAPDASAYAVCEAAAMESGMEEADFNDDVVSAEQFQRHYAIAADVDDFDATMLQAAGCVDGSTYGMEDINGNI
jgi:predicted RNA-binding Zn-ribbon protein involved in translation (DUF1610 family)